MNELEEMEILNKLINSDFSVYIRTKIGIKNVISITKKNGLIVMKTIDGTEVIEAPKTFLRREFVIEPTHPEPNPLTSAKEIYEYLKQKKEIIYRGEKVIELKIEQNKLILKTENGNELILSPSDMFEYPVYVR
jgi:hypothetical protein